MSFRLTKVTKALGTRCLVPVFLFTWPCGQAFVSIDSRAAMADEDNEFERPRKIPKTLKEKDSGKRLIVILEKASLETVKVLQSVVYLQSLFKHETRTIGKKHGRRLV